jgi:hypothetical protein
VLLKAVLDGLLNICNLVAFIKAESRLTISTNILAKRIPIFCLSFASIYILPLTSFGQLTSKNADSIQVANTMREFINVFSNLEWDKFIEFFSDSATAFFPPSAKYPYRANNKMEI